MSKAYDASTIDYVNLITEGANVKTTADYLNEAKERLGIKSDYALANWLGVTRQSVSSYKLGKSTIDDYAAAKIAEALGINPMDVIAAANYEREKDVTRRAYWGKFFTAAGITAVGILALWINSIEIAYAAQSNNNENNKLSLMRNCFAVGGMR